VDKSKWSQQTIYKVDFLPFGSRAYTFSAKTQTAKKPTWKCMKRFQFVYHSGLGVLLFLMNMVAQLFY
jgi:hypothetical protein